MNRRSDENTRDDLKLSVTEAPDDDTVNGDDRTVGASLGGVSMSTSAAGDRSTEHQFDEQSVDGVSVRSFLEGFRGNTHSTMGGTTTTLRTVSEAEVQQLAKRLDRNLAADGVNMLIGHYFVTRLLGSGGMGRVFAAIDTRLNREVALKLLHPELTASERGKVRLVREAQAMAKVSHPNVAAVYEVGESDECFYVAMELVKGVTLRDWLRASPTGPTGRTWREVVELFVQAGNGLAAAHEVGLVHRDFKPENVMLGDDGRVRVLDFGLAFLRASEAGEGDDDAPAEPRARANQLVGTVAYMSPEQFLAESLDARSDQFSYCVSLFESLFGHRPFAGRTVGEIVHNTIAGNIELQPTPPQLPSWLIAVLRRGMATERDDRYASVGELVGLLEAGRATPWLQVPRLAHESARDRLAARLRCTFEGALLGVGPVALWRARRQASNEPLVIALPLDVDDERARALLSAYFDKARTLDCAALLRPTELVTEGQLVALVFDDLEAVALEGLMQRKTAVELSLTLRVGIQLTNALHLLTLAGLPVEHVRLGGALVHTRDYRVVFFDPQLLDARALVDAPRYRQVGMALQRMLSSSTSKLDESDAVAFDEHLPGSVKQIVELLLHPTNSYRSARGLAHDLETCLAHAQADASKKLPIATRDVSDRFVVSDVIRGRKDAIEAFRATSRRVQEGAAGLFLLSGPPGIGKSALVELLCSELDHARRIRGKFDQFGNNEPYATIVQALRELVRQLVDDPRDFRGRILEAVAPNAALLFSVIPEIRTIIGEQPPVATLPPAEASLRFRETLKNLIRAFASPVETLVVVLDDMQWCDPASLEFITSMLDDEVGHILWLGAFREQAVSPEHPLQALLDGLAGHAPLRQAVRLGPLSDAEIGGLIADTLACPEERTAKLATFVRDRTDGNPLFAQTLLASLHDQGLFVFSPREECWTWDDDAIRSAELPNDLLDLIGRKFATLSAAARLLLSTGSCIGRDIEAEVLLDVCAREQPRATLEAALDECVTRGLLSSTIVRTSTAVRGGGESVRLLNFTHDRVQQTAWQSLDDEQRSALNLEIGCKLLDRASPDELQAKLFRIVGHLNAGASQLDAGAGPGSLRDRIIELDLIAGKRALVASAFADAAKFLQTALALLPEDLWSTRYEQAVELHVAYMHAESLLGNRAREDEIFELLREHVTTAIHRSEIYELKVMLDSARGEHHLAIARAREGLELLGERLPRLPGPLAAMTELARTGWALRGRTPESIAEMEASAQEDAGVARLLVALSSPAYLTDANLLVVVMMRIVRQALRSGVTNVSSHGFAGYGLVLSGLLDKNQLAERFGAASLRLNDRFRNPWLQPKVDLINGIFILPWTQPFAISQDMLARGLKIALENADFPYASYNATSMVCVMYYRGLPLERVIQVATTSLRHTQRAGHYDMEVVVTSLMRACMCLRGQTASSSDYSGEGFDEAKFSATIEKKTTPVGTFFHRAIKVAVLYLHGHYELACEVGREATTFEENAFSNPSRMECRFYYAMALCRRLPELSGSARARARKKIKRVFAELQKRAGLCPANFAARQQLLAAELARVFRKGDVLSHLNTAIEAARSHGNTHYEALGSELAAAHCAANNQHSIARVYLKSAIEAYQRWGAVVKARELAAQLPAELSAGEATSTGGTLAPLGHG
jgi:predicted ATPase